MYCVFLRISAKVISTLAEKMPTLTLSVPSNPTHSLQHLLFETLQNCQHCTHKAKERERGEGLSKNKERIKKKVFQCQVIHGDAQGVCQRSFKKCIMANAHDSTGCQKCKKKFHNRLAALRTASKVEIEAADNIF